jgi:hypothetical protein
VHGDILYWLDASTAAVLRMPVAGGAPETLATARGFGVSAIAVDATNVYWPDGNQAMGVFATPVGGGTTTTLAAGVNAPLGLALDATTLYFVLEIANPGAVVSVAVDDANVYWAVPGNKENGAIMSVPKGGGTAVTVATGAWDPFALAADATSLYWTTREGYVLKVPKPRR